jgi:dTDP-4-amino-4,6-dideoxygalactose transaminase
MDELQAEILLKKLTHLDGWNTRRRTIVEQYKAAATDSFSSWFHNDRSFAAHLAVARHPERDAVRRILHEAGIATDVHYPILDCDQPSQYGLPMVVHELIETRKAISEILTLPCFPELTDDEVQYVCECLSRVG